jgi:hypothetical protein
MLIGAIRGALEDPPPRRDDPPPQRRAEAAAPATKAVELAPPRPSTSRMAPNGQLIRRVREGAFVAAATEGLLDRALALAASGDQAAFERFILAGGAVVLRPGTEVYLIESSGWGGKVKVRPTGQLAEWWTVMEAVAE